VRFAAVHHKTVGLLGWATKPRPEARRAETGSGCTVKLLCRRTHGGIAGLALEGADCSKGVAVGCRGVLLDHVAPEGCVSNFMF
jgi:hypothetical protein